MQKIVKCRYAHCNRFHESKDLPIEEAVKSGNQYYHKDCYIESNAMKTTIDLFAEHINENVVFSQLRRTINNIVYEKGCDAEFLEFGLRYYIDNKIPLNYPGGLYYVIQNKDVQKAWDNKKHKEISEAMDGYEFKCEDVQADLKHKGTNRSKFSSILK